MSIFTKVILGVASVGLLAGCTKTQTTTNTITPQTNQASVETRPANSGGLTVTLDEYSFAPKIIEVAPGGSLTLTNAGNMAHTFNVADLGISEEVGAGETKSITVPNNKLGTFTVTCTVAGHEALGMTGQIVVE
jgi:plastocyanin